MCSDKSAGATGLPELPDLLTLGLSDLRALDHPVLSEVLAELRARVSGGPAVTLWTFDEFAPGDESGGVA
ncbi:FxSxx-COOH protein [Streptomyces carpaticus]|uniref:FXSXX-COOH protein n=2 Tax=Streptomyces TaxID=1883 RepID=A0A1I6UEE3_9ACTN|nr:MULTISPECIES: FxSxx-COOH cyclophane-containing RiPP peptide [Streptomyces]QKV70822.1 FXSXX-COOH protein [Streptomyces harbinensis]UWM51261.1 FxSxx-COOH protein [Streptomyces carpaticus]SFS99771.1 FXSXX-COOH protein [Streptomyces harbinensis]